MQTSAKRIFVALSAALLVACSYTRPQPAPTSLMAMPAMRGEDIATRLCSSCHAIGRADQSTHPDSLPFRKISMRYPVRNLEEALGEGIFVGHPDMPPFRLDPNDIDDLLDYIEAIQDPA